MFAVTRGSVVLEAGGVVVVVEDRGMVVVVTRAQCALPVSHVISTLGPLLTALAMNCPRSRTSVPSRSCAFGARTTAVTSLPWPKATRVPATLRTKSLALRSFVKPIRTAFDRRRSPQTFTVTGPAATSVARVPSLMLSNRYVPGASSTSASRFAKSEPYAPGARRVGPSGSTKAPKADPAQVNSGSSGGAAKRVRPLPRSSKGTCGE